MASGVGVCDSVIDAWLDLKKHKKYKFVTFLIKDEKLIEVDQASAGTGDQAADYQSLVEVLKEAEAAKQGRYAAFDLNIDLNERGKREKIVLITWCPASAAIKQKMLYTSSKSAIKGKLREGIGHELQANDLDDLDYEDLVATVSSKQV